VTNIRLEAELELLKQRIARSQADITEILNDMERHICDRRRERLQRDQRGRLSLAERA
jgi:hypothetical protein